jgi:hypothetical protein
MVSCSLRKGSRQNLKDRETGKVVSIFNPRQQRWMEHFIWDGVRVVGLTVTGRITLQALDLNRLTMLAIRAEEAEVLNVEKSATKLSIIDSIKAKIRINKELKLCQ